jgi:hypothetical protein
MEYRSHNRNRKFRSDSFSCSGVVPLTGDMLLVVVVELVLVLMAFILAIDRYGDDKGVDADDNADDDDDDDMVDIGSVKVSFRVVISFLVDIPNDIRGGGTFLANTKVRLEIIAQELCILTESIVLSNHEIRFVNSTVRNLWSSNVPYLLSDSFRKIFLVLSSIPLMMFRENQTEEV